MGDTEIELSATSSGSSSIGEAISGRGQNVPDDDDDDDVEGLFYIPERRASLDLGPSPMETSQWHYTGVASPPALSYWSMTSEENSVSMDNEVGPSTKVQLHKADSFSSSYSVESEDCEKRTFKVKIKDNLSKAFETPELIQDPNVIRHPSLTVAFTFKAICKTLEKLCEEDVKTFRKKLWNRYPQSFRTPPQSMDVVDLVDKMLECNRLEVSLQITKSFLEEIGNKKMVDYLQALCIRNEVRHDLKEVLRRTYSEVCEDTVVQEGKRSFEDVFTNPYITSTCNNSPNIEHEVMTIGKLDSNQEAGRRLFTKDILCTESLEDFCMRILFIIGVAGSGKSMWVRKLVLDWIEGRSHQHVSFLFPFSFIELKQFEGSQISLLQIVHTLYPMITKLRDEDYRSEDGKIMFVFDGLDEYGGKLDFQNTELLMNPTDPTNLNVILVNLLKGRLFNESLFVVTSRPQVKHHIPWDVRHDEIDILGFSDPDKDEFFKKRFQDPDQAARVIAHINSMKTLRIMCHLPLFCSLVADEYQCLFREQGTRVALPRSITYMYTKLLLTLIRPRRIFRAPDRNPDNERDFLLKLGKLAFNMLEQGQFRITQHDWNEVGISDVEAVSNSGLCTQYLIKSFVLYQKSVFSFIHPTMQEYLAALYAFLSFSIQGKNVFEQKKTNMFRVKLMRNKVMDLYKSAVNRSLQCADGKLDISLRFLFGMTVNPTLDLLQSFCTSSGMWASSSEDAAEFIRKKIREISRNSNLHLCLEELGV